VSSHPLRIEQRGRVRWLFLNRPAQRNALNIEVTEALAEQVESIATDEGTTVAVIAGEGPSFSAGGDFRQFLELRDAKAVRAFLARLSEVVSRIEHSSKPWIAALHGHAIAGGLELALACDVVVAAEGTVIGDGHVNNRLLPGAGSSVRLERAVGKSVARWMHLSGQPMTAEDLRPTGWLHDVVPRGQLLAKAETVATRLASRDPMAQQGMKKLLVSLDGREPSDALTCELDAFESNWLANDVADALEDFLARRDGVVGQEARR
jgi:enoyl-CoA hydratase